MITPDNYPSRQPDPEDLHPSLLIEAQMNQLTVNNWVPEEGLPRALARICNHLNIQAEEQELLDERVELRGSSLRIPNPHQITEGIPEADLTIIRDIPARPNLDDQLLNHPASVIGRFAGFHYDIDRSTTPPTGHILAQVAIRGLPRTRYTDKIRLLASCSVDDEDISLTFLDKDRIKHIYTLFSQLNRKAGGIPHLAGSVNGLFLELFRNADNTIGAETLRAIAKEVNSLATHPEIRDNPEMKETIEALLRLYLNLPQSLTVHTDTYHIADGSADPTIQTLMQPKRFGSIEPEIFMIPNKKGDAMELCFVAQTPDGLVQLPWQYIRQLRQQTR